MSVTMVSSTTGEVSSLSDIYSSVFPQTGITGLELRHVLYCILGCIGFLDNLVVIITISLSPSMRKKRTNWFLLNQSVIDLITAALLAVSVYKPQIVASRLLGNIYCKLWYSTGFLWAFALASTYNLLMITVERYVAIVHPVWHKNHVTKRHFLIGLIAPYVISNILNISSFVQGQYDMKRHICVYIGDRAVGITAFFLQFAIPLGLMIFCYGKMVVALAKKQIRVENSQGDSKWNKARLNVIKTLVSVCVAFILCWSWNQIYFLLYNMGVLQDFYTSFYVFSVVAAHMNCAVNPFIYAANYKEFQKAFGNVWGRKKVQPDQSSLNHNGTRPVE